MLPGARKEEKAIKEKDKAQVEMAREQLPSIEVKVRELLKTEVALL